MEHFPESTKVDWEPKFHWAVTNKILEKGRTNWICSENKKQTICFFPIKFLDLSLQSDYAHSFRAFLKCFCTPRITCLIRGMCSFVCGLSTLCSPASLLQLNTTVCVCAVHSLCGCMPVHFLVKECLSVRVYMERILCVPAYATWKG